MASEEFEREKACYEQNFLHARSINDQMNRIPTLAITLTGGLWFGAGAVDHIEPPIRFGLLIFAGICNIALILTAFRVRDVFQSYLDKIREFCPERFATGMPAHARMKALRSYSMISIHSALMLSATLMSWGGALGFYWPLADRLRWVGIVLLAVLLVGLAILIWHGGTASKGARASEESEERVRQRSS